ncbi:hypothetical protein [Catenulispora subtropica]|uniref:Uncharacterized protein n=1 Tax=Catenulispora subtropica TaxID=450798 RepID=A0ABN2RHT8_9ACTN
MSQPVREVELPAPPHESWLDHHRVNPPRLVPGTYSVDEAEHGRDRLTGTYVLSPGDVRGVRFVHELVRTGCWSLDGWQPCLECEECGVLVASRLDDCYSAQETRLYPDVVVREQAGEDLDDGPDPFALGADWDRSGPELREVCFVPPPQEPRPALVATRWLVRGLKSEVYRDDPPA